MRREIAATLVALALLASVGAPALAAPETEHTAGVVGSDSTSVALAGSTNADNVVWTGDDTLYRPGAATANKWAQQGSDSIVLTGDTDASTQLNYFGGVEDESGEQLYSTSDWTRENRVLESVVLAQEYYAEAPDLILVTEQNAEAWTYQVALNETSTVTSDTMDGPVLVVNGTQNIDDVQTTANELEPSGGYENVTVGPDVSSEAIDGVDQASSDDQVSGDLDDSYVNDQFWSASEVDEVYVVSDMEELGAVTPTVDNRTYVVVNNDNVSESDVNSSDWNTTTIESEDEFSDWDSESQSYDSIGGLVSIISHEKRDDPTAMPAVSDATTDNGTVSVEVENVGTSTALDTVVTIDIDEEVEVSSDAELNTSYDDGSLRVEILSIASGESVVFEYEVAEGEQNPRVTDYEDGTGSDATTFSGFSIADWAPSELTSVLSEIEDIQEDLNAAVIVIGFIASILVIGLAYWYTREV